MANAHNIAEHCISKFGQKFVQLENNCVTVNMGLLNNMYYNAYVRDNYIIDIEDDINVHYYSEISNIIDNLEFDLIEDETMIPTIVIQQFIEDKVGSAGFVDVYSENEDEVNLDDFFEYMKSKATPNRILTIYTFGNKYKQFNNWRKQTDISFSVLHINSKRPKNVSLRHARGTDEIIQKTVMSGTEFENTFSNIVRITEEKDFHTIGVYCRAGHHRAVATGELLKKHVYTKASIIHLTINK